MGLPLTPEILDEVKCFCAAAAAVGIGHLFGATADAQHMLRAKRFVCAGNLSLCKPGCIASALEVSIRDLFQGHRWRPKHFARVKCFCVATAASIGGSFGTPADARTTLWSRCVSARQVLLPLGTCLGATADAQHTLRAKSVFVRGPFPDAAMQPLLPLWRCKLGIPLQAPAVARNTLRA